MPGTSTLDDLIASWPPGQPLVVLTWAAEGWSFVAQPTAVFRSRWFKHEPGVHGENRVLFGCRSEWLDPRTGASLRPPIGFTHDALEDLARVVAAAPPPAPPPPSPKGPTPPSFRGGWVGLISYDLGRILEPKAQHRRCAEAEGWPLLEFQYCSGGFLLDHDTGEVQWIGDPVHKPKVSARRCCPAGIPAGFESTSRDEGYQQDVVRVLDHIRAGDVYQVNLAHRLTGCFSGSTRAAFLAMHNSGRPWYGAYLELAPEADHPEARRALLSMSPELFLDIHPRPDGSVRILTRPMKGTRPGAADPDELRHNPKDRAELNMIVDLMRNDLGRICQPGTVRVEEPRAIETHGAPGGGAGAVLQATATITGILRDGLGLSNILRATFPPGSVTGAPKIRAMQIIDELEPVARGPYCGAIGWIGSGGRASFNVAIRTALVGGCAANPLLRDHITRGTLEYSVGAGIVADSRPEAEWQETLDKAGVLAPLFRDELPLEEMPVTGRA